MQHQHPAVHDPDSPFVRMLGTVLLFACLGFLLASPARAEDWTGIIARCSVCHNTERICRNLDRGVVYWTDTVIRMKRTGAQISESQEEAVVLLLSGKAAVEPAPLLGCMTPTGKTTSASSAIPVAARLLHPSFMGLTFILACWVATMGISRARFTLLKHAVRFDWKRHVKYGLWVMIFWGAGMVAGSLMTGLVHGAPGATGLHRTIAMTMAPLIIFGAATGIYMDRKKKPRTLLPVLHGVVNLILIALAASQLATGFKLVRGLL